MRIAVHDYAGHPFQFELSRELARRGHEVAHLFFAGDPGPKGHSTVTADDPSGLTIQAIELPLEYRKDSFSRRFVADHLYGREVARRIKALRPDIVISGNTPIDTQRMVSRAASQCGSRFVFWVQDFFGIGVEKVLAGRWRGLGDLIARRYRNIENRLLENSDEIILISPDFERYLPNAVVGRSSVHVIRNWGMLDSISPRDKRNPWARRQGLTDKFVFMYTGTLALKHDPGLLLALCDAFADDEEVAVVLVAAGVNADVLASENRVNPRRNLTILPLQPVSEMPDVLATADGLVAILEQDAAEFAVPSKLLSYLCAGRPILLSAPGRNLAARVLEESGGGLLAEAADPASFIAAARRLREDQRLRQTFGAAGRAYAQAHFDIEEIATRFEHVFGVRRVAEPDRVGVEAFRSTEDASTPREQVV